MANRGIYLGSGIGLVDGKGRVAIPNAFRATLSEAAGGEGGKGGTVIVGVHQKSRCCVAFGPSYLDKLIDDLDRREREHAEADGEADYNIKRRGGMGAEATPFDPSGRFIMPGFPRFHAEIEDHAFFWGAADVIEIWNPRVLFETEGAPAMMVSACRFHLRERGIAA